MGSPAGRLPYYTWCSHRVHLSDKTRAWERDRRERLNTCFNQLSSLLPNHEPTVNLSKIEILQKAAGHIRELQQENRNLLQGNLDESTSKQVEQLKQRVEDLQKRIQQLVRLLQDAGISVPPHPVDVDPRPRRWTKKFKPEDAEKLLEEEKKKVEPRNEAKKKKKVSKVRSHATPLKTLINNFSSRSVPIKQMNSIIVNTSNIPSIPAKKSKPSKNTKGQRKSKKPLNKLFGEKLPTVAQLLGLTMNDIETSTTISVHETSVGNPTLINTTAALPPGFIVIQGNNNVQPTSLTSTSLVNQQRPQQCIVMPTAKKVRHSPPISLVLSRTLSKRKKNNNLIAVTKSHLLTAPVIANSIQTCPPPAVLTNHSPGLAGLGPGTLILANGNIVPVLPQLTATPTQFIVNSNPLPAPTPPPVIMMQQQKNTVTITTSSNGAPLVASKSQQQRSIPVLVPKVAKKRAADSTVTTFANKVPIPALSLRHQPPKMAQVINNAIKSPGKAKGKSNNESVVKISASAGSNKISNLGSKTTPEKEKNLSSDNAITASKQSSPGTNINVGIAKDSSEGKEKGSDSKHVDISSEKTLKPKDALAKASMKNDENLPTEVAEIGKNNNQNKGDIPDPQSSDSRKRKKVDNDDEDCSKKKMLKHDEENMNKEGNNSSLNGNQTTAVSSSSTSTSMYTIDALCTDKSAHSIVNSCGSGILSSPSLNSVINNVDKNNDMPKEENRDISVEEYVSSNPTLAEDSTINTNQEDSESIKNVSQEIVSNNNTDILDTNGIGSEGSSKKDLPDSSPTSKSQNVNTENSQGTNQQDASEITLIKKPLFPTEPQTITTSGSEYNCYFATTTSSSQIGPMPVSSNPSIDQPLEQSASNPRVPGTSSQHLSLEESSPKVTNLSPGLQSVAQGNASTLPSPISEQITKSLLTTNSAEAENSLQLVTVSGTPNQSESQFTKCPTTMNSIRKEQCATQTNHSPKSPDLCSRVLIEIHKSPQVLCCLLKDQQTHECNKSKNVTEIEQSPVTLNTMQQGDLNGASTTTSSGSGLPCPTQSPVISNPIKEVEHTSQILENVMVTNPSHENKKPEIENDNSMKASSKSTVLPNSPLVEKESCNITEKQSFESVIETWQGEKEIMAKTSINTEFTTLPPATVTSTNYQLPDVLQKQQNGGEENVKPDVTREISISSQQLNPTHISLSNEKSNMNQIVSTETCLEKTLSLQTTTHSLYPSFTSAPMITHCNENAFIPIANSAELDSSPRVTDNDSSVHNSLTISLQNHEFSNDLFASLQVPTSGQHPESISPTAAFLLAFPLVSSSKVSEMIVDSQEEVGGDSMQGTSTLLQIGNIEPSAMECSSKAQSNAIEAKMQQKVDASSQNDISGKNEGKVISPESTQQQTDTNASSKDTKASASNPEKSSTTEANFSTASNKQWSSTNNLQPVDKLNLKSRNVGTQAQAFNNFMLKTSENQNSLIHSVQSCDSTTFNISLEASKDGGNHCFSQQIKERNSSLQSTSSHIAHFKSGEQQKVDHSRNLYPSMPPFDPVLQSNMPQDDNCKKLTSSSVKFSNSVAQPLDSLCMKSQLPVTTQQNQMQVMQTFHSNKEQNKQNCQDIMTQVQTSANSMVNQHPFSKLQTSQIVNEQGTMTEATRTALTNSSAADVKHSFSSHRVVDSTSAPVHSSRALSYSHMPPTSQPYSYNLFTNDYNSTSSQVACSASFSQSLNATNDQIKTTSAGSFSVAHNSSNFSILSWTTLSPMSASTNTNQYDSFHMPSQNLSTNVSHQQTHTTTIAPIQKSIPQADVSASSAVSMPMPVSAVNEMEEMVHDNSCQKQCKNERNIVKPMNDGIRKLSETYQNVYTNEEQQSLAIPQQSVNNSHVQYHNDSHAPGPSEDGGTNANFKYPTSTNEGKSRQSTRANPSGERVKSGQPHRPPVNWMTTPDIRTSNSVMSSASSASMAVGQPIISMSTTSANSEVNSVQMNREFEFCSTSSSNNIFMNNSNITHSSFDSRNFSGNSALYGNPVLPSHSNLYTNNRQSTHLSCNKEENNHNRNVHHNPTHQRLPDLSVPGQNYHSEAYPLPWTGRKVSFTSAPTMPPEMSSNNFVPSTLPTLVGDLALGTNYPISGNDDSHHKSFLHPNFHDGEINKKSTSIAMQEDRQQEMSGKQISNRQSEKDSGVTTANKVRNAGTSSNARICTQEYHGPSHNEVNTSGVSTPASGNFLSVSQLVDQVKSGTGSSRAQINANSRRNGNNRQVGNKSNGTQTRQHNSNTGSSNKRNNAVQSNSERDSNKKQQLNFPVSEGTTTMTVSGDSNRKTNETTRESHYSNENGSSIIPPITQGNAGFSIPPVHDTVSSNSHHHWLPNRGKPSRTNSSSYKAPVSSYSAEALIGLNNNSNTDTTHLPPQEPPNKVITLPPPVVTERFSHNQNYHHHHHHHAQSSRSIQMSSSFGNDSLIPSNYFDLPPPPHHQEGNASSAQSSSHNDNFTQTSHQNQQPYSNTSFSYSAGTGNMSVQSAPGLYPTANFVSNANTNASIPPVSLPTGFLSDLTSNNSFTIPSDSNSSLIFAPPPIMKGVATNRSSRHNTYLNTAPSSIHHQHQHLPTRNDNSSGQTAESNRSSTTTMSSSDNTNRRPSVNTSGHALHHQSNNLSTNNNTNCSLTKRGSGSRRRIPEPISSTSASGSGITGLVDLGYLPMPPGIGSPMLGADDGTYLGHHPSGTFLAHPGSQLYPGGPAGASYPPPPRPPAQVPSQNNHHSGSHLPPFSSCAPVQQNTRASHHHQQQQANSSPNASGNSLANFNLSTIFPEINDKQGPAVPPLVGFPGGSKNLAAPGSSLLPSANSSHHLLPPTSSEADYAHRVVPPPVSVSNNCLPPPPPPVPLPTNFNNLLSHAPPQVGRMQWP